MVSASRFFGLVEEAAGVVLAGRHPRAAQAGATAVPQELRVRLLPAGQARAVPATGTLRRDARLRGLRLLAAGARGRRGVLLRPAGARSLPRALRAGLPERTADAPGRVHGASSDMPGWPTTARWSARPRRTICSRSRGWSSTRSGPTQARAMLLSSIRRRPTVRALAWVLVLSAPDQLRRPLSERLVSMKRTLVVRGAR